MNNINILQNTRDLLSPREFEWSKSKFVLSKMIYFQIFQLDKSASNSFSLVLSFNLICTSRVH